MVENPNDAVALFPGTPGLMERPTYLELPQTGFEERITGLKLETLELVRRFANGVMRPQGMLLDRMTPEEVVAKDSPYWTVLQQYDDLGLDALAAADLSPADAVDLQCMINEELGWGDVGLAGSVVLGGFGRFVAAQWGRQDLVDAFPAPLRGCWAITEPDAGSDMLDWDRHATHPLGTFQRPNLVATLRRDKIILNGQKSAWVGDGPTADYCLLFTALDRGQGREGIAVFVSLNQPGVARGKPIDKMGMRAEPQGEIFFDNVEVPINFVAVGPDRYGDAVYDILCKGNVWMGTTFVGVARAAYEHALSYAHERKQGGVPIIQHQNVRYRLFHMLRRIEAARALARRVARFDALSGMHALHASIASKVTSTQTAFEVANDALQLFGGNGLCKAYPVEKLLRDARASLIADGCNEVLSIKAGSLLIAPN